MPKRINVLALRAAGAMAAILVLGATAPGVEAAGAAQARGAPPLTGNPTPGTPQPAPPNLADRITLTGCVQAAPGSQTSGQPAAEPGAPSDSRFILTNAKRETRVPPGAGTSSAAAAAASATYRLAAIESALSPFVGTRVEISGQIETPALEQAQKAEAKSPVLRVEFVQKLAATCQ
jgi:hypothetical protein